MADIGKRERRRDRRQNIQEIEGQRQKGTEREEEEERRD